MEPSVLSHFFPHCPMRGTQGKPGELLGLSPGYRCPGYRYPGKSTHRKPGLDQQGGVAIT